MPKNDLNSLDKDNNKLQLTTEMKPIADQITAIDTLVKNIKKGVKSQVLLGATGTGKTFTIANVINQLNTKTLIIVHNKTLAAQLYGEFKELFKNNNVEYFISYFDYYRPEAYVPSTDSYIEKETQSNKDIEMMRLSTINSLSTAKKVIVIASVAAIYASVSPEDFESFKILISKGQKLNRKQFLFDLVKLQYTRNEVELQPGTFRIKGEVIQIAPGTSDQYYIRIKLFDDEVESIAWVDALTGDVIKKLDDLIIYPANEYIMNDSRIDESFRRIEAELKQAVEDFTKQKKLLEAQRIDQRTRSDIEQMKELGYCSGIENYSRHLELRAEGETPFTLFDYFKNDDWLLVIDESHKTIPQIRGMFNCDRSRKQTLVDYGFRLKSCLDNRPLNFKEFNQKIKHVIYCSATPDDYEIKQSDGLVVQQIVRPTGLVDPSYEIKPMEHWIDDLMVQLKNQRKKNERTLITVLTKNMAETLADKLKESGFKAMYLHSELKTLERSKIINELRRGKIDVLVGIKLLREGLDIPEVSLICILDADKPGLFRDYRSLIQTFGRAARNVNGHIIMYADSVTKDMKQAMEETDRRRNIQIEYNKKHHITPKTIEKAIRDDFTSTEQVEIFEAAYKAKKQGKDPTKAIAKLRKLMNEASKNHEYEKAIYYRDLIIELNGNLKGEN